MIERLFDAKMGVNVQQGRVCAMLIRIARSFGPIPLSRPLHMAHFVVPFLGQKEKVFCFLQPRNVSLLRLLFIAFVLMNRCLPWSCLFRGALILLHFMPFLTQNCRFGIFGAG